MPCQDCPEPRKIMQHPIRFNKNTANLDSIIVECINGHKILGISFENNPKITDDNCAYFAVCNSSAREKKSICKVCSGYTLKGKLIITCPLCNKKSSVSLMKEVSKIFPFADNDYLLHIKTIQPIDEKLMIELIIQEIG
jgi:hypothetical protein